LGGHPITFDTEQYTTLPTRTSRHFNYCPENELTVKELRKRDNVSFL
jgi:hypothetical protein